MRTKKRIWKGILLALFALPLLAVVLLYFVYGDLSVYSDKGFALIVALSVLEVLCLTGISLIVWIGSLRGARQKTFAWILIVLLLAFSGLKVYADIQYSSLKKQAYEADLMAEEAETSQAGNAYELRRAALAAWQKVVDHQIGVGLVNIFYICLVFVTPRPATDGLQDPREDEDPLPPADSV